MAVIGAIRNRTGILIGFIAVAMLLFLIADPSITGSLFGGGGAGNVGKINGKPVDYIEYQNKYSDYESRVTNLFPSFNADDNGKAQLREEVWNQFAADKLLGSYMNNLGISVSDQELGNAIWGDNVHFFAQNVLVNPETGRYDNGFARLYVNAIDDENNARAKEFEKKIYDLENMIKEDRIKAKYASFFNKGVFIPDFLAAENKALSAATADLSYIFLPYNQVEDGQVSYTDKDLQNYIDQHADAYDREESRTISYYTINIVPSVEDTAQAIEDLNKVLGDFRTTDNDSLFIRKYSDEAYYGTWGTEALLEGETKLTEFFTDEVGTFYEPYFQNESFYISKLIDKKVVPDSIKARHVMLVPKTIEERDSLILLMDSLENQLAEGNVTFDELVRVHNADNTFGDENGDLGYFNMDSDPLNSQHARYNAIFRYKQGDVFRTFSNNGFHLIKIDRAVAKTPAVKVGHVSRKLKYSKNTERDLLRDKNNFRATYGTAEKFEAIPADYKIETVEVAKNDVTVQGLGVAREMVQWAYKEKPGVVSDFDIDDRYIVAYLKGGKEAGVQPLDAVKGEVELKVANEKKAAYWIDQVNNAGSSNIQELASALGKEVTPLSSLSYNARALSGGGNDSDVVGYAFGLEEGALGAPIAGEDGVYVIQLTKKTIPEVGAVSANDKAPLKSVYDFNSIITELLDESDVKDERFNFY